jgi:hypothetical protein
VTRRIVLTAVAFVVGVTVDLFVGDPTFPGFAATIGVAATLGLSLLAKGLVGPLVQRPEDYYPLDAPPTFHADQFQARHLDDDGRGGDDA